MMAPQEAVPLTPLIYAANSILSDLRPQLIPCCKSFLIDLALLGSVQLPSETVP